MNPETLRILRFVADGKNIKASDDELIEGMKLAPIDYGSEGWVQVLWHGRVEAEFFGDHFRWIFYP
jgi:hypothetical protein